MKERSMRDTDQYDTAKLKCFGNVSGVL